MKAVAQKFMKSKSVKGKKYTVTMYDTGAVRCDCSDFKFRSGPSGKLCKHGRAALLNKMTGWKPIATN